MRQRGKAGSIPLRASNSFTSSDSDDYGRSCRSKKPTKPSDKKSCNDKKNTGGWPCFGLGKKVESCVDRMKCGVSGMSSSTARCFVSLLVIPLALLVLYIFGPYLWSVIKLMLPPSMFKSTTTIVDEALARYNADKLGLADYALESAGGSILCSSNTYYSRDGALYSIFGVPLWYHASSPREVIQPDVQPGKCWAMDGTRGYVMIQLSMPVVVTAISLEHIPAQVAPTGRLDSAPKDFVIVGKENNMESPDVILGNFLYNANEGHAIQTYPLKDPYCIRQTTNYNECGPNRQVFRIVELRVLSNHGNRDYTCIYRLRVHGKPLNQAIAEQEYGGAQAVHVP